MPEYLFTENTRHNLTIALAILLAIILTNFGILQSIGINLNQLKIGSWSYNQILSTFGLIWVAYGLWKRQFGGG